MLVHTVIFAVFFVISSLIGQGVHWALHQQWMGRVYRSHDQHHRLYPIHDLTSKRYRNARWQDSGTFLFAVPFVAIVLLLCLLGWLVSAPGSWIIAAVLGLGVFGIVTDIVHDHYHLDNSLLANFAWFKRCRELHFVHHLNSERNFGIVTLAWDRLFGTFSDEKPTDKKGSSVVDL